MTSAAFLRLIATALRPAVEGTSENPIQNRGKLDVSADPYHAYQLLSTAPKSWRVILGWEGTKAVEGTHNLVHEVTLAAYLQQAAGLAIDPGKHAYQSHPSGTPLLDKTETFAQVLTGLYFEDAENPGCQHPDIASYGTNCSIRLVSQDWLPLGDPDKPLAHLTAQVRQLYTIMLRLDSDQSVDTILAQLSWTTTEW